MGILINFHEFNTMHLNLSCYFFFSSEASDDPSIEELMLKYGDDEEGGVQPEKTLSGATPLSLNSSSRR
jgi:hypothetical protein